MRAVAVLACLAPGLASAATVASFSAEAGASLTLLSARIAGSRTDASEFLDVVFDVDDAAWSQDTTGTGTLSEDADLSRRWEGGLDLWVQGAGQAAGPAGSAAADAIFDHAVELLNLGNCWPGACDVSVRLTFGYRLSAQASAQATASASARAFLGIGKGGTNLDLFRLSADAAAEPLFGFDASDAQSRSGSFSVTLGPDESLFAYLYVEYDGHALVEAPAPVPLPASALLLAGGLGGLGAFRRRCAAAG